MLTGIFILCVAIVVMLQVGDYITTKRGLARGAVESNPIVRKIGLIPAKVALTSFLVGMMAYATWGLHSIGTLIGATVIVFAVYAYVILHNLDVAKRARA